MNESAFQGLKRTFMHVSGLPQAKFDKKNHLLYKLFFLSKMVCEDLRHAKTCVSEPETEVYACIRSSPTII